MIGGAPHCVHFETRIVGDHILPGQDWMTFDVGPAVRDVETNEHVGVLPLVSIPLSAEGRGEVTISCSSS